MPRPGLTENYERSLLATLRYAAKLLQDGGQVLRDTEHYDRLSRYGKGLTPPQRVIIGDYLARLGQHVVATLDTLALSQGAPSIDPVGGVSSILIFLDDTFTEPIRPSGATDDVDRSHHRA